MYKISAIIEDAFRNALPLAEKLRIGLDIDFPDPTMRIERPSLLKNPLNEHLELAIRRAKKRVSIVVSRVSVVIRDDGVALTPDMIREITDAENISIKSRVGFGTEVKIKLV